MIVCDDPRRHLSTQIQVTIPCGGACGGPRGYKKVRDPRHCRPTSSHSNTTSSGSAAPIHSPAFFLFPAHVTNMKNAKLDFSLVDRVDWTAGSLDCLPLWTAYL